MTKVIASGDCGNSPKSRLLQELTIAMARADVERGRDLVTADMRWLAIGRKPIVGVDAFCRAFARYGPASALSIDHVISHGRAGAVNGVVRFADKDRAFCHVYEFANARGTLVKALTSYAIALK